MGRTVAIVNQKGGVGKTTVALGLASAALAARHRVLVVDLDPQGASSWVLGVDPNAVEQSTAEALARGSVKGIVESAWGSNVHVLPASPRLQARETSTQKDAAAKLRVALGDVSGYEAILIDCPPSLGNLTTNGLTAADHAIIVVELAALSLRGISTVADVVDEVWDTHNPDLDLAGVIVNKAPAVSNEADRRYDELARIVGKRAVWQPTMPQRVIVNQALAERRPLHSYGSRAADVTETLDRYWVKLRRVMKG